MTTTAGFSHMDPADQTHGVAAWTKVDVDYSSFGRKMYTRQVHDARGHEDDFSVDTSGFAVYNYPAKEKLFVDDEAVRNGYYAEVEALLKDKLGPGVKKVVIFDHTIRRRLPGAARAPVQAVHVDQTPAAADVRVRRHIADPDEAERRIKGRYQLINVWRPIENAASDHPLAVIDWRSTKPEEFVPVNLLYPKRKPGDADDDDRGKEVAPDRSTWASTEGYEARGETMRVLPSEDHRFYYVKDMTPDEVLLLKCYDSHGEGRPDGRQGVALRTPHSAFEDPNTPKDAPPRQSIEVRCLVFYE
ncbi:uncharacterized protein B0I36DRAFT_357794 [Microdochium trichocladiopsis]|uniref:Methyltransferase n=1 Tax=Microdochium trichocladiopsis TaxID=1682393 RepID=A0A9P8YHR6_9PEZI|nr:uncharacterized protein B0I36DRAFT_357794 [Microdochium trichocladiopsis]KAH7040505.1 hypothetical protein B0I36DRAFT_357794 [Microdochium trichocladiopsis]